MDVIARNIIEEYILEIHKDLLKFSVKNNLMNFIIKELNEKFYQNNNTINKAANY
jgi:hypothetical protein